jgi:hypothetical protein
MEGEDRRTRGIGMVFRKLFDFLFYSRGGILFWECILCIWASHIYIYMYILNLQYPILCVNFFNTVSTFYG